MSAIDQPRRRGSMAFMADRRNKTMRDMAISMGVVVAGVLLYVGIYGGFSFSPGAPTTGQEQTADVQGGFATAGRSVPFPVVIPKGIPANWHPSSFSITRTPSGSSPQLVAVAGGWLTPGGAYITLVESSGTTQDVLQAQLGESEAATGSVEVAGITWTITPGRRSEAAWVFNKAGVVFLITGDAANASFEILADSVAAA